MAVKTSKNEQSLDQIVDDFSSKLAQFKEAKWEQALMAFPIGELDLHMSDLDMITDKILCSPNTQEALKLMSNAITQIAWTTMRKKLLEGIHTWYRSKLTAIKAGKLMLEILNAKQNDAIEDADYEDLEEEMASQFEATVEHIVSSGEGQCMLPCTIQAQQASQQSDAIDTITEPTAEQLIAQSHVEES